MIEISSILAPTDFSTHSERAVRYACQLAERLRLRSTCCMSSAKSCPAGPDPLLHARDARPVLHGKRRPRPGDARVAFPTPPGETRLRSSGPSGGEARSTRSFLMRSTIDRHDRRSRPTAAPGLSHVLLGSVAEHIVREAPCPVLTIRDNARNRPASS